MGEKKVLYLLWGEDISHNNGIFLSQVYSQLIKTKELYSDTKIICLSGIPILKKRILINWKEFRNKLAKLEEKFKYKNVDLKFKYLPIFSRFNSTRKYFYLYSIFQKGYLKRIVTKSDINIIHCRSYHSTFLALKTREKYSLDYKVVFDARGIVPEEGVVKNKYSINDDTYIFWKEVEKYLLENSDAIITMSEPFTKHYEKIYKKGNYHTVYTSSDQNVFRRIQSKESIRKKYKVPVEKKILVYLGSIGQNIWHTPEYLFLLYKVFRRVFNNSLLLIITKANVKSELKDLFRKENIPQDELMIRASETLEDTNSLLNLGDYGAVPFRRIGNDSLNKIFGNIIVGSKTGEYLSVGLPVISNEDVGGVKDLIKKYPIGITYNPDKIDELKENLIKYDNNYEENTEECILMAKKVFSTEINAKKHYGIYSSLLKN